MLQRVLPLLFVLVLASRASFLFPGEVGDDCTTGTGGKGTCSLSCGHTSDAREAQRCGIQDSKFLYCCEKSVGVKSEPVLDISSPAQHVECGINTERPIADREAYWDDYTEACEYSYFIVQGEITKQYYWPWMALLGRKDAAGITWLCGGALINRNWVVTAAHCMDKDGISVVRLGEYDHENICYEPRPDDYTVQETVFYPDYNLREAYHDLALIKLNKLVDIKKHISPVCLPWGAESSVNVLSQEMTVTGWGDTEYRGLPSSILQKANVTVFSSEECARGYSTLPFYQFRWPQGIGEETLCAGDPLGGRDACQGDSGGPLVSPTSDGHFVLAAIVSRGYGCGHEDFPGLYVNLRNPPYLAWIKKTAF